MSEHTLKVILMIKCLDNYDMELVTTVKSFTVQTHGKEQVDMSEHTSMKKTGKDENLFFLVQGVVNEGASTIKLV
jgi:hypothetical protein